MRNGGHVSGPRIARLTLVQYQDERYLSRAGLDNVVAVETYFERLGVLCACDYLIVLDGQLGTLTEAMVAWNVRQTQSNKNSRIFVLGPMGSERLAYLKNTIQFSKEEYAEILQFASDVPGLLADLTVLLAAKADPSVAHRPECAVDDGTR